MSDIVDLIRQGKVKRFFRSRRKLDFPGLVSHITQRATGKEPLFVEDGDYLYMIKLIRETAEKYELQVLAFCLMGNHLHILLLQKQKNLSAAMHNLFTRYAIYFNYKYQRKGHLFAGPFGQAACFDDHYLFTASVYIHLNPVRARIVDSYRKYRWSTWRLYCQDSEPDTFVNWKFIIEMLARNHIQAKKRYRELLRKALNYRGKEALEEKRAIGKFSIWIKKNYPDLIRRSKYNGKRFLPEGYASDAEIDKIIQELREKKRLTKPDDIKARKFAIEQLQSRGYSVEEIVDYMEISRATIYNYLS